MYTFLNSDNTFKSKLIKKKIWFNSITICAMEKQKWFNITCKRISIQLLSLILLQ